jgi:hypothetical protein
MPQSRTGNWTIVTDRQSKPLGGQMDGYPLGYGRKEIGPIAFEVNQQAIDSLRNNLNDGKITSPTSRARIALVCRPSSRERPSIGTRDYRRVL